MSATSGGGLQLGLASLGDWMADPSTGRRISQQQRIREIVEYGVGAEALGFDGFHLGEHHFCDYIVSRPVPMLAAVAERTQRLRVSTGVTLLGNHDPVAIAEDFATLDLLSGGRAELVAGRGVVASVYGQFGQQPDESRAREVEAVELLRRLWTEDEVTWSGRFRPPLDRCVLQPRPLQRPHPPIWLSGSKEESVEVAARLGLPVAIPLIITGVANLGKVVDHYRSCGGPGPVSLLAHTYVAPTTQAAVAEFAPHQHQYLRWVMELVSNGTVSAASAVLPAPFELLDRADRSIAVAGSPAEVIDRIEGWRAATGFDQYVMMCDQGGMPHGQVMASVERFATEVAPTLRGS